jgi:DNA-binding XRE family transcriptional regulator
MTKEKDIVVEMKQNGLSMETDRNEFALALKTWRLRNRLTQQQVAERWGVTRLNVIKVEKARPISWMMAYRLFACLSRELKEEGER